MVNKYLILSLIILVIPVSVYAEVQLPQQDNTIGGIIVPKVISTQSLYCDSGKCATSPVTFPVNYTLSHSKLPILLISLSQTCEILDKYNAKGCPSVRDLIHYDNSNQLISGKFVNNSGIFIRTQPQASHNWMLYQYSNHTIICVECVLDVTATEKSQQIIIQPNSFSYVNKSESESKNTFYNFANRYMQGCDIATIANIPGLLNDTIHYMLDGCITTATSFNGTQKHTITHHGWSYNNPFSTLHLVNSINNIMHGHSGTNTNRTSGGYGPPDCFRHHCNFTDPYKKAGW